MLIWCEEVNNFTLGINFKTSLLIIFNIIDGM